MASENTMKEIYEDLDRLKKESSYLEQMEAILKHEIGYQSFSQTLQFHDDEGLKDGVAWLKEDLIKLDEERENILMKEGCFLRIPKGYELVNEDEAKDCDGAAIIPIFNGEQLELPTFVYFYKKSEITGNIYDAIEEIMAQKFPAYNFALDLDHKQKTFKGYRIMTLVYIVEDAEPFFEKLKKGFENRYISMSDVPVHCIAIYRNGDPNATTNKKN